MQADYYIIRLNETAIMPREQLIDTVLEVNGYIRGTAPVDFQFATSIDAAYMTTLVLMHEEKSGKKADPDRSRMHNISGGATGKLSAIFYTTG